MKKTVEDIKNQTFTDFEVLILDGNSDNETQNYLKTLEAPFLYQSKQDEGIYDAMNKGISLSVGSWLYFLGAGDCFYNNNTLKEISHHFINKNSLVFGNSKYDLGKNSSIFKSNFSSLLWIKNTVHHQSLFYNRNIFSNQNYDIKYKILADYDLNIKLLKQKIVKIKLDQIVSICDPKGISKEYNWQLYSEEISLKTKNSSFLLKPLFFLLSCTKFLLKK